jgi:hypothetical protein
MYFLTYKHLPAFVDWFTVGKFYLIRKKPYVTSCYIKDDTGDMINRSDLISGVGGIIRATPDHPRIMIKDAGVVIHIDDIMLLNEKIKTDCCPHLND